MTYHKIPNPDVFLQNIANAAQALNLPMSEQQSACLLRYLDNMLLWNKSYNLTAITEPNEALIKHIFDCLAVLPDFGSAYRGDVKTVLDIGTGAGLPSVILAIMRPDWQITALDKNNKKVRFVRQMIAQLSLNNLSVASVRIEDFEGQFDVITSRAFASLEDFVVLAMPYLAKNGVLCAMKGKQPSDEELQSVQMCSPLNWQITITKLNVPNLQADRCLVHLSCPS